MLWLSTCHTSDVFNPIVANRTPWANLETFWQFCQLYGDYQATPPSLRRRFIQKIEQDRDKAASCSMGSQ